MSIIRNYLTSPLLVALSLANFACKPSEQSQLREIGNATVKVTLNPEGDASVAVTGITPPQGESLKLTRLTVGASGKSDLGVVSANQAVKVGIAFSVRIDQGKSGFCQADGIAANSAAEIACVDFTERCGSAGKIENLESDAICTCSDKSTLKRSMFMADTIVNKTAFCKGSASDSTTTDLCSVSGGRLVGGTCKCSNGTPVFKLRNESCQQHLTKQNPNCTSGKGLILYDNVCNCGDGTPVAKRNPAVCEKPYWEWNSTTTQASQQSTGSDGCTKAGGTLVAGTCKCSNGTPVYKLRSGTCVEHLAAQTAGCKFGKGLILYDNTCNCGDGTPVYKRNPAVCEKPYWEWSNSPVASPTPAATQAAVPVVQDGCTKAGGTLVSGTCKCSNGTPVFKLRTGTCVEHLAAQTAGCKIAKGLMLYDNTCNCGDGVPVFRKNPAVCEKGYWEY